MDVQMPVMDGLEATRRIRANERQRNRRHVPVIALTASVLDADRRAARDAYMDGFASKPIDLLALTQEMARVLGLTAETAMTARPPVVEKEVLNLTQGLRRWVGRTDIYHRALGRFVADYADMTAVLVKLVDDEDRSAAQVLVHKIRGGGGQSGTGTAHRFVRTFRVGPRQR